MKDDTVVLSTWGLVAALFVVTIALAVGCYHGTPPCNPGTVDWPRCDPTQPSWGARADGGGAPDGATRAARLPR